MELYHNKIKKIIGLFPKTILVSDYKEGGYRELQSYQALRYGKYVAYNSEELVSVIAVDIDHHKDGGAWIEAGLPEPTWTIWTDRGVQFAWALEKPILMLVQKHREYAIDVLKRITYALDGDRHAMSLNRIFRNPLTNESRITDSRVHLKDFTHLPEPPRSFKTVFDRSEHEPNGMREGDGRNVALFDLCRFWAYESSSQNEYDEFGLTEQAYRINGYFAEPLQMQEVESVVKSIDKFISSKYGRGNYMKNTTPEKRKEIARRNGKKGGAIRKAEAYGRIVITITQMQSFDIKITVSEVARRAKCSTHTARNYLKEKGWKEVSRKEGWKQ